MVAFSGTVQSDFLKEVSVDLDNKQRLIDFAASDFITYRQALIDYVKATFPLDYNNFSESDFGMLLIELMASVGHIQSNKSDYLANENFIGTARSRDSVKRLLELIGVRMKGPISAAANASISFTSGTVNPAKVLVGVGDRAVTVESPQDKNSMSYTLYKVNNNGTVDLDDPTTNLVFSVTGNFPTGVVTVDNAVLLEGALVVEEGTFRSGETLKSINLGQGPYVEKSAQVFIEGNPLTEGVYKEEENIYFASGSSDKIFQVVSDENFKASLLFGDSSVGMSPSIGDRYTVTYRVGGGSRGNIGDSYINAPVTVLASSVGGTESIAAATLQNTSIATGGRDAETVAQAKRYGPLWFRSQDRLVTLGDYRGFANRFASNYGSTGKAVAVVRRAYSSANIIDLFVLERASDLQLRRATQEYKRQLIEAIDDKKMLTDEVVVVDGLIRTLDLFVVLTLDEKFKRLQSDIIQVARNSILNYMNMDNTDFGERFEPQDLIRTVLENEPQIRFARVDNVESTLKVGFNEIIQLNNLDIKVEFV